MAADTEEPEGHPQTHLWAKNGCLDKLDKVQRRLGKDAEALKFEKTPKLNWLKSRNAPCGYYIPQDKIKEADAERTTGVKFSNTKKLRPNIECDFLDDDGQFGRNGKFDGEMDVSWWGSCDLVATAGMRFDKPKRAVSMMGVRFNITDIKGLLTIAASQNNPKSTFIGKRFEEYPDEVQLSNGRTITGKITNLNLDDFRRANCILHDGFLILDHIDKDLTIQLSDGTREAINSLDIISIERENPEPINASMFHKTVKSWLRDKRPFSMDVDPGSQVWNQSFDTATIHKIRKAPRNVNISQLLGDNGPYSGKKIGFYRTTLSQNMRSKKHYHYWIEKDITNNQTINSGWFLSGNHNKVPCNMWRFRTRPQELKDKVLRRNPGVSVSLVNEIYQKSIRQ